MGGIMAEGGPSRRLGVLALSFAVIGCGEAATIADTPEVEVASPDEAAPTGDPAPAAEPPTQPPTGETSETPFETILLEGRVRYEDRPYDPRGLATQTVLRPARFVVVEATALEPTVAVSPVRSTTTDGDGRFAIEVPEGGPYVVTARASVRLGDHRAEVRDRTKEDRVYALRAPASSGAPLELVADARAGLGGAFNIVDTALEAFAFYAPYVRYAAPPLTFRWQPGVPFPCGSCFSHDVISVGAHPDDTDEFDDDILLHEIGHYFVEHYSHDDSPGGFHRDRRVDPRLAFGEGLAYFFTALVRGTPLIVDTYARSTRVIDIEAVTHDGEVWANLRGTADGAVDSPHREEIVAAVLWDALDPPSAAEPFDRVRLSTREVMALLLSFAERGLDYGRAGLDLSDLLARLVCSSHARPADVEALVAALEIRWRAPLCP